LSWKNKRDVLNNNGGSMNNSNDQEPKDTKMMTDEMKHEFRNMTENMDNSMDGPIGDIEDLAHMNGDDM
jgi:hypothetical protein